MLVENGNRPETRILPATLEVYELLSVPVLVIDTGFNIIYINEKACEMTGYSREEAREKKLFGIAAPGELKKSLLRLFAGEIFDRDFTIRGPMVTRNGRIRSVEWQCRTMFQGIFRAGAVITFTDLTGGETVLDMARIMAGGAGIESAVNGFMDILSDPLNLKRARILLNTNDRKTMAFFRAYPHGAVHKKPRQALMDSCDVPPPAEVFSFPLHASGCDIGSLELTPYGGSGLTVEDEAYVRRLCDIFSTGIRRLIRAGSQDSDPAGVAGPTRTDRPPGSTDEIRKQARVPEMARQLIDLLPHGVITCDQGGIITSVNGSVVRMTGLGRGDLEGHDMREIIRRLAPQRVNGIAVNSRNSVVLRALRTGSVITNTRIFARVCGSLRELAVSAIPVRDEEDNVSGCMATIQDITVIITIVRLARIALEVTSAEELIEESLDLITNAMSLRLVSLYLWDEGVLKLKILKGNFTGMQVPDCQEMPDPQSPTLPSRVCLGMKPLLIKDYRRCASVRLFDPLARRRPIRSMAGVPLMANGHLIGVLVAATGEGQPMDDAGLAELSALCSQLSAGIGRVRPRADQIGG